MAPRTCVDYLSYNWMPDDLILTRKEVRRQTRKIRLESLHGPTKRHKVYQLELFQNTRLEYAIWRQMARVCAKNLGGTNAAVSPSLLDWQKEADVTCRLRWIWRNELHANKIYNFFRKGLYGPLVTSSDECIKRRDKQSRCERHQHLKPVLKKKTSREWQCLRLRNERSSNTVHFSQQIQQIRFLPDTPVLHTSSSSSSGDKEEEEEERLREEDEEEEENAEDDAMWILAVETGHWMKQFTYACVEYLCYFLRMMVTMPTTASVTTTAAPQQQEPRLSIAQAASAIIQSTLATLVLYKEWDTLAEYVQTMILQQQRRQLVEPSHT